MVKSKPDTRSDQVSSKLQEPAQPEKIVQGGEYFLSIVKCLHERMMSLVLLREKDGVVTRTVLGSSEKLYDLLDDMQRVAYRIYGLDEIPMENE